MSFSSITEFSISCGVGCDFIEFFFYVIREYSMIVMVVFPRLLDGDGTVLVEGSIE